MTLLDPSCVLKHLTSLPLQASIYIRTNNAGKLLRFTKTSATSWKHTDGFARPGTWIKQTELAKLGTPTNPFKETTP